MKPFRSWLVLPALLLAAAVPALGSEVRDKAGLFSAEAVRKAQADLDRAEREYKVPVTIETVTSLDGEPIKDVVTRHAESANAHGIYIVIAKKEAKIFGEASHGFLKYFPRDRFAAIDTAFTDDFKARNFDAGLEKGVAKIGSVLEDARTEAGGSLKPAEPATRRVTPARGGRAGAEIPAKPRGAGGMSIFSIVLGILALFLVIRVIGALFAGNRGGYSNANRMGGGPGYGPGGPGYGGAPAGGGGFMNSMFGGIGGALAGNWLYDQFSGRHNSGYADQGGYDPNAGVAPTEPAAPEWGEGGAGADWGGGADTGADAGGDWGGGGGGDWGGEGGGDDGASW